MRRVSLLAILLGATAILATVGSAQHEQPGEQELLQWAASLLQRAVVIDGHCDTVMYMVRSGYDLSRRNDEHHIDIPRMLEAGMNGQFFACFIYPESDQSQWIQTTLRMIDALHRADEADERFVIAYGAEDILRAKREGQVAGIIAIEGGHAIMDDLAVLRLYHRLGVRYMTLTWNNSNNWADSSEPDQGPYGNIPSHGGLTEFGRQVVREMNRLGMIIDLSHTHLDTVADVLEVSTAPVIASHSCCWALNPHNRNLTDEQLRAIARNGGVVGINYYAGFVSEEFTTAAEPMWNEMRRRYSELREQYGDDSETLRREMAAVRAEMRERLPAVPLSMLVDHIDHAVRVAGIDHVGLGSDFDGISSAPQGLDDVTDIVWIVVELRRRGYSEADIRKILGENFLRLIREAVGS